ncbi:MAG: Rpn family recombination-promoting nuclease/putative transposase [Chitinophagia bacterium]|nr:Rpn family recombination-promoting nuclease/putative transposase [Chitinophagia bacterium]
MAAINSRIRYDWAMKRLLRDKENYGILSGFLSALLKKNIIITGILESETNQLSSTDKFTRVDILAEEDAGTKFIIEVQNTYDHAYLQRMLYGASKMLVESVISGEEYETLRKVISVNILYYDFQGGNDSIYRGTTRIVGDSSGEELALTKREKELYIADNPSDLFPKFIIIALSNFDGHLRQQIDAWMYLFINDSLPKKPDMELSPEVKQAEDVVHHLLLDVAERKAHDAYLKTVREISGGNKTAHDTGKIEGRAEGLVEGEKIGIEKGLQMGKAEGLQEGEKIGIEKGKAEGLQEGEKIGKLLAAKAMLKLGISINEIAVELGLSEAEISGIE